MLAHDELVLHWGVQAAADLLDFWDEPAGLVEAKGIRPRGVRLRVLTGQSCLRKAPTVCDSDA